MFYFVTFNLVNSTRHEPVYVYPPPPLDTYCFLYRYIIYRYTLYYTVESFKYLRANFHGLVGFFLLICGDAISWMPQFQKDNFKTKISF